LKEVLNTDEGFHCLEVTGYRGNPLAIKVEMKNTILRYIYEVID